MKEFRFRVIIILLAVLGSLALLYPTYVEYQNNKTTAENLEKERLKIVNANPNLTQQQVNALVKVKEDSILAANPDFTENKKSKRIKLGLDLQGGMRLVLEVNTAKLLEKVAKNTDDVFKSVLKEAENESLLSDESVVDIFAQKMQDKGIRLSKYFGTIKDEDSDIIDKLRKDSKDAVDRAKEIIRNRVDQYGVSEPSIQTQGSRRLIVELPGVAKEEEAKQLLQGTALLEFRLVKDPQFAFSVMQSIDNVLAGVEIEDSTSTNDSRVVKDSSAIAANQAKMNKRDSVDYSKLSKDQQIRQMEKDHPFFSIAKINSQSQTAEAFVAEKDRNRLMSLIKRSDVQKVIPNNIDFLFSAKPAMTGEDGINYYLLYCVNKKSEITGGVITDAQANIDPTTQGAIVNMVMSGEGASNWARITGANIDKRIAIILDEAVFSAPVVRNKITGGRSQIEGMGNLEEAKLLEIVLKAGALPAPVNIIEERTVGPSLGQDSIDKGLFSGILGYILVGLFMVVYYKRAGGVATIGLVFTILFLLALLAAFSATLTLPGIAGIILTIGMAVDTNVLIYERMREEVAVGKTMKAVVDSGFSKAFSAIIDSNVTTLFTGIILYQFGTGPIQGFALTLMIGILTSLFGNLVIARLIFDYMVYRGYKITIG